ncbi:7 transmembrane sweet-taste receptor of 3 GCPR [Carpediemonas membranifera]|uniref:7 transmembrane sweet-taste receptor of 3 GCPR n=1 Tax=Carpediemonas membranifera TaxID=201153 RepID=A0A8J6AWX8_9EUKA|nr:7 transmembrane sweet-taste receptor of 3 GCPR [Carpediemonas membranifera]|eukprot:KAG9393600.1 7 transmembrane sweet-taste receptor of 3 GCPR [Carpediemonas membranifera]
MLHEQFGSGYSVSATTNQTWLTYADSSSSLADGCNIKIICTEPRNMSLPNFTIGSRTIVPDYHAFLNPTWYETAATLATREPKTVLDFLVHMDTVWNGVTTIFQRVGDDFVRIVSTVPVDYGGEVLAVGAVMQHYDADGGVNERSKALLEGEEWSGPIELFSQTYYSAYAPIVVDGEVVGALYFGSTAVISGVCFLWLIFTVLLLFMGCLCIITQCICCRSPPFASGGRSMTIYILTGCILCALSALIGTSWPGLPAARCWAETWLFYLGESMALAALTAKTFRVWRIFQKAKQFKQSYFNPMYLHGFVWAALALQAIFLVLHAIAIFIPAPLTLWVSPVRPIACDSFLDPVATLPMEIVIAALIVTAGLLAIQTRSSRAPGLEAVKEASDLAYVVSVLVISAVLQRCVQFFDHDNIIYSLSRFTEPAIPPLIIAGGLFLPKSWRAAKLWAREHVGLGGGQMLPPSVAHGDCMSGATSECEFGDGVEEMNPIQRV